MFVHISHKSILWISFSLLRTRPSVTCTRWMWQPRLSGCRYTAVPLRKCSHW